MKKLRQHLTFCVQGHTLVCSRAPQGEQLSDGGGELESVVSLFPEAPRERWRVAEEKTQQSREDQRLYFTPGRQSTNQRKHGRFIPGCWKGCGGAGALEARGEGEADSRPAWKGKGRG